MSSRPTHSGFEPRTRDAERRDFFDLRRRLGDLESGGGSTMGWDFKGTITTPGPPTTGQAPSPVDGDLWIDSNGIGWAWNGTTWVNVGTVKGPPGATGPQGVTGPPGAQGPQGVKGDTGATGAAGPTGATGPQGPIGLTGAQGPQGVKGDTGATGPTGATGSQGPQGPIGLTGPQGPQGIKGDTGATGSQGPQGTTGATGAQGPHGIQGPAGPPVADGDKGDITVSGGGTAWAVDPLAITTAKIADDSVTNAKLANMTAPAFKGRATAGAGDPEDLTGTQATALLDAFTATLKGVVPASAGGTVNFLRADGTWAPIPASMPRGYVAHAVLGSTFQTTSATEVDITGATVTFTADPTRRYKVTAVMPCFVTGALSGVTFRISDAANVIKGSAAITIPASSSVIAMAVIIETGLSGSTTRKLRVLTSAGTLNVVSGTIILVEDIGV